MKNYPDRWWAVIDDPVKPDWEILPSRAAAGEVIVSKRNELGILSNLAATPFEFEGVRYASVEGLWQMTKYPEGPEDPRSKVEWPAKREDLISMSGFESKALGDLASDLMKEHGFDWVTYRGVRLPYPEKTPGPFYDLIERAMQAKLDQNPRVRETLLATGDLILRPDHEMPPHASPAHHYYAMWMILRSRASK